MEFGLVLKEQPLSPCRPTKQDSSVFFTVAFPTEADNSDLLQFKCRSTPSKDLPFSHKPLPDLCPILLFIYFFHIKALESHTRISSSSSSKKEEKLLSSSGGALKVALSVSPA